MLIVGYQFANIVFFEHMLGKRINHHKIMLEKRTKYSKKTLEKRTNHHKIMLEKRTKYSKNTLEKRTKYVFSHLKQTNNNIPHNTRQKRSKIHQRQTRTKQLQQNTNTTIQTTIPIRQKRIPTNIQQKIRHNRLLPENQDKNNNTKKHQRRIPTIPTTTTQQNNQTPKQLAIKNFSHTQQKLETVNS